MVQKKKKFENAWLHLNHSFIGEKKKYLQQDFHKPEAAFLASVNSFTTKSWVIGFSNNWFSPTEGKQVLFSPEANALRLLIRLSMGGIWDSTRPNVLHHG